MKGEADATRIDARLPIREEVDVALARGAAMALARDEGLDAGRAGAVATATSELAWNIVRHAGHGEIVLGVAREGGRRCVVVVARDGGGGIADVAAALRDGYTTCGGLGLGLPSARRLMDELVLESEVRRGTTVSMKKWLHGTSD